ncbi:MAG: TIGR04282 family arsenosugar biosynthesis glycosyltransferase [Rhizobiaceae bacterium]
MKCAIAIFAKTAGLSPVKTRLAETVGRERAETFYQHSVASIENVVCEAVNSNPDFHPFWALAEAEAVELPQWRNFPALWTGKGDLGERLANISEQLFKKHDAVIFIGTDSPQLTPRVFEFTHDFLQKCSYECLIGPATDGGFYLFGSASPLPRMTWETVTYSERSTLAELEEMIEQSGRCVERLKEEQDVDTEVDLHRVFERLSQSRHQLLPAQKCLLDWLESL